MFPVAQPKHPYPEQKTVFGFYKKQDFRFTSAFQSFQSRYMTEKKRVMI